MAEGAGRQTMTEEEKKTFDEEIVRRLPSIPSSDEVTIFGSNAIPPTERAGSIDERLHRLRTVTQGVIAARKFQRTSSIQGKYVAITPNERDNLEHIQHMTEDITARLDRLRDFDAPPTVNVAVVEAPQPQHPLYVPTPVQGKFIEFVPFDACSSRPASLDALLPPNATAALADSDISPLPPLPPADSFAFFNGDDAMDDDDDDDDKAEGAYVTESLERRLRMLSESRTQ